MSRTFLRSAKSPNVPPGTANKTSGNKVAVWTSETMSPDGLRSVINQPEPTLNSHVPAFETKLQKINSEKEGVAPGGFGHRGMKG